MNSAEPSPSPPPLSPSLDFKAIEEEVRKHWSSITLRRLIEEKCRASGPLGFIEGPPTMNGEPHIGHIRGRVMKDLWYRFMTLRGHYIIFRAGWDTQGLPVELQAERELGLTGSKVENLRLVGEERLVAKCKELIHRYNEAWVRADRLLGMSFDYDNAYWTYKDEYIEREWSYLERAWRSGLLGEGYRVVAYCPSCQTSLSHEEVRQGYERVEDPSLYYKVKLIDGERDDAAGWDEGDTYLIIWTTMPFTLITDELVAVHPDAEYSFVRIGVRGETWVIGANRVEPLMKELGIGDYEVVKTIRGRELEGRRYLHPLLQHIPAQQRLAQEGRVHKVVSEEFVDITTGTGLVHLSPANGEEDFEVAQRRGLPIFNPIDDQARFTEEAGSFAGLFVRDADDKVAELLREEGLLLQYGRLMHDYPLCWRSKHKLIWTARREYFYWIDKIGELTERAAERVEYFYDAPKRRFLEIIKERVPWCISRERVWGAPLPIWVCSKCGQKTPAFSRKEILEKALELPDGPNFELHRPWIDRVVLRCDACGSRAYREPFVLDTWHNSGASPYSSLTDEEYRQLVPVPFLTEGIDQTRGWAYTLLVQNVIYTGQAQAPYRAFLFQGHVLDEKGNKMSKSLGNLIDGYEVLSNNPVDVLRFYLLWKAAPIDNLNFSFKELLGRPYQVLSTLYHLHLYFQQNSSYDGFSLEHDLLWVRDRGLLRLQELWILSRLQRLIEEVTRGYERCRYHEALRALERFTIEDLSQTYIPYIRTEIWDDREETKPRRLAIYSVLAHVLRSLLILLHPVTPFITDFLYRRCHLGTKESILLEDWPSPVQGWRDEGLEGIFALVAEFLSLANAARMKARLKRRWPLRKAVLVVGKGEAKLLEGVKELLLEQINVKEIEIVEDAKAAPLKLLCLVKPERLAKETKRDFPQLKEALERRDAWSLRAQLEREGTIVISVGERRYEVKGEDLAFRLEPHQGYAMVERNGRACLLMVVRDRELLAEGLARDLARRLQALRKERGYNPTDLLDEARIAGLDEEDRDLLKEQLDRLSYLVRVRRVVLEDGAEGDVEWSEVELEGRKVKLFIG